ncbi:valine--tRNA ligase, partial [Archaeoglobales archaeon]
HLPYEVDVRDISGAINAKVEILDVLPDVKLRVKKLKPKFGIIGPMFKDKTKEIVNLVNNLSEDDKMEFVEKGEIEVNLDGQKYTIKSEWFDVEMEKVVEGKAIESVEIGDVTLFIEV